MKMDYRCPKCTSENIQRLSLLVASGSRKIGAVTIGGSGGGGGKNIGIGLTGGTEKTLLASKFDQPKKSIYTEKFVYAYKYFTFPSLILFVMAFSFVGFLFDSIVFGVIFAGLSFWLIRYIYWSVIPKWENMSISNEEEYRKKLRIWENSFCCLRCGETFQFKES